MHILIFGRHKCESTWLQTVLFFYVPLACVLMLISVCLCDDWQFCLVHVKSLYITHLLLFTREETFTKEISAIDESVHVAVGSQLLEMSYNYKT